MKSKDEIKMVIKRLRDFNEVMGSFHDLEEDADGVRLFDKNNNVVEALEWVLGE